MCLLIKVLKIKVQQTAVMNQIANMQLQNNSHTRLFIYNNFPAHFYIYNLYVKYKIFSL